MNTIKFCEESVFLMLNFVKCPKTDPRQTPEYYYLNMKKKEGGDEFSLKNAF